MAVDFDVGKISFELVDDRPQFESQIKCPNCRPLTLDEVELTEIGQTELTEIYLQDVELEDSEEEDLDKMRVSLKNNKRVSGGKAP